jgi:hypothetical protein
MRCFFVEFVVNEPSHTEQQCTNCSWFHGGNNLEFCLLWYEALWLLEEPTFRRIISHPCSEWKASESSHLPARTYLMTDGEESLLQRHHYRRRHFPEDNILHCYRRPNIKKSFSHTEEWRLLGCYLTFSHTAYRYFIQGSPCVSKHEWM